MIRWMQDSQNLWQFQADTEAQILDYLAENYPPQPKRRRAPIPASLMPQTAPPE
jgi:predicted nucleic acid-binding OB-fold protein